MIKEDPKGGEASNEESEVREARATEKAEEERKNKCAHRS
jgi:hypothetical protein